MSEPRTDDFRVERRDSEWVITFTPTGARYYFGDDGMETRASDSEAPPEDLPPDYDPLEVERMAALIAYAARGHAH
ncbi:hypothetical protein [Methylocystis echinoides]|jgi:hypothetical protein|uniref:Uncharacterized protein n=1 Tax=Methylocystis echinoides TaxID=29468 RepID=A0A9W6GS18_9HYPH|nr:hypothetical protein [Methylocystis echinoides]GLI92008.1 hypothetical protein LMG27198_10000 [Methylocystis echinoides]